MTTAPATTSDHIDQKARIARRAAARVAVASADLNALAAEMERLAAIPEWTAAQERAWRELEEKVDRVRGVLLRGV